MLSSFYLVVVIGFVNRFFFMEVIMKFCGVLLIYNMEIIEGVWGNGNGILSKLYIVNLEVCY